MILILMVCIMKLLEISAMRRKSDGQSRYGGGGGGGGEKENRAINGHLRNYFSSVQTSMKHHGKIITFHAIFIHFLSTIHMLFIRKLFSSYTICKVFNTLNLQNIWEFRQRCLSSSFVCLCDANTFLIIALIMFF